MAGLINDNEQAEGVQPPSEELGAGEPMPEDKGAEGAQPAEETPGEPSEGGLDPKSFEAKMQVPPEFQDAYTRVVAAGMKVLFDQSTHPMAMKQLQAGGGPLSERLGKGAASLIFMLAEKSKGALPPQVFIPAASTLLVTAADFLKKSGLEPVQDSDIADGLNIMIELVLKAFKADPAKVQAFKGKPGLVDRPTAPQPPEEI